MIVLALALQVTNASAAVDDAAAGEVRRGWAAARDCASTTAWTPVSNCLANVVSADRAKHSNFVPFIIGLKVATWDMATTLDKALKGDPSSQAQSEANFARSSARLARVEVAAQSGGVGLADEDIPKILPIDATAWKAGADAPFSGN